MLKDSERLANLPLPSVANLCFGDLDMLCSHSYDVCTRSSVTKLSRLESHESSILRAIFRAAHVILCCARLCKSVVRLFAVQLWAVAIAMPCVAVAMKCRKFSDLECS